jgi:hypothetical protein
MSRVPNSSIIAGALALLVLVLLFGWGVRVETEIAPPITIDPGALTADSGVVVGKLETGGFSFLGLDFGRKTYSVDVHIAAPPGCADSIDMGEPWPSGVTECHPSPRIVGEVAGLGLSPTGESVILVRSEVGAACYDTIEPGDVWPTEACR